AHIALGTELWWEWRDGERPALGVQVVFVAAVFAAFAAGAWLWRRRFTRGPLEGLLRAVARYPG
ncbi:MAG: DUF418 domain-containing protein, partial [Acidimicrobiales bacterium]